MILITHDLGLVAGVAERVQVMYGGRLFETADDRHHLPPLAQPLHARADELDPVGRRRGRATGSSRSRARRRRRSTRPAGCVFRPRCPHATGSCRDEEPELRPLDGDRRHWTPLPPRRGAARLVRDEPLGSTRMTTLDTAAVTPASTWSPADPVLEIDDLVKHFPIRAGLLRREVGRVQRRRRRHPARPRPGDPRRRRRVGVRQVDARAVAAAAGRTDVRHGPVQGRGRHARRRRRGCASCASTCRWCSRTRTRRSTRACPSATPSASR